jgi:hypothetical protein
LEDSSAIISLLEPSMEMTWVILVMSFMSGGGERKTAGFFGRLFFREIDGLAFTV